MPTYDYRCDRCGEVYERTRSIEDRDVRTIHLPCGGNLERIYTWRFLRAKSIEPWEKGKTEIGDMPVEEFRNIQVSEQKAIHEKHEKKLKGQVEPALAKLEAEGGLYRRY